MRVMLDCNVVLSASLTPNSTSSKVVRILEELHVMLASEETVEEFLQTILQTKFDKYFRPVDTCVEIVAGYSNKAEWITPTDRITVCRDPKDNKYLELALSGQADCIITGDRDLLSLNPFKNISIISPSEFLDQSYTAYTLKL